MQTNPQLPQIANNVSQSCLRLGISRAGLYNIINRGEIKSFTIGGRRMITEAELHAYVQRRMDADQTGA